MTTFHQALETLVATYRQRPFGFWAGQHERNEELHDYASFEPESSSWWQADTSVLEVAGGAEASAYALVAVTLYPRGVHSSPPAPTVTFCVYRDGRVSGQWSNGTPFGDASAQTTQPNKSSERTRDR